MLENFDIEKYIVTFVALTLLPIPIHQIMKIKLILLMVAVALNASAYQVMDTSSGVISEKNDVAKPTKTVTTSENGYTVTYSFPELIISRDENGEYNCRYPDFGTSHELGFAALPFIGELYMIPEGSDVEVSIQDSEYTDYSLTLAPAQEIPVNSPDSDYVPAKLPITVSNLYLPTELAGDVHMEKYRGNTFARVRLTPMQYNSKERKLRVYTSVTFNLEYAEDPDGLQAQSSAIEFEQFPDLLSIGDYAVKPAGQQRAAGDKTPGDLAKDYLILTVPSLKEAADRFADWKRNFGYNTHVISEESWTTDLIKQTCRDFMTSHPKYAALLIFGSHQLLPAETFDTSPWQYLDSNRYPSDMYYTCYDGEEDEIPDVWYGRIPVDNSFEATLIVNKIIQYEGNPPADSIFYNTGTNIAYFQPQTSNLFNDTDDLDHVYSSEYVRDRFISIRYAVDRLYTKRQNSYPLFYRNERNKVFPEELKEINFDWQATTTDIVNAINNKTQYVLYRAHGAVTGWENPNFYNSDIIRLNNQSFTPVIFSLTCYTGKFNSSCFNSELIKSSGGCVAVVGASFLSGSLLNSEFAIGMFDRQFSDVSINISGFNSSQYCLGELYAAGMENVRAKFDKGYWLNHNQIYHWFGDPTMKMWIKKPEPLTDVVMYSKNGTTTISIGTKGLITMVKDGVVSSYSGTQHSFNTTINNNTRICVTRDNCIPLIITTDELQSSSAYSNDFGINFCAISSTGIGVKFSLGSSPSKQNTLSVYDINGSLKYQKSLKETDTRITIPVTGWTSGTYILSLNGGTQQDSRTINL